MFQSELKEKKCYQLAIVYIIEICLILAIDNSLFENMERICDDNYIPSPTDVLRARVRTNGIIETNFRVNDTIIRWVTKKKSVYDRFQFSSE